MTFAHGVVALHDVSLAVHPGEFIAVLGPSGAGKSTFLRTLNRLVTPTSGRVLFQGEDVTSATGVALRRLRQSVGMIFQQFHLVGRLSVMDNVLAGRLRFCRGVAHFAASHARWFGKAHREVAMDALQRVGIAHLAPRRADTLSGGQQQRVAIARLLAQEPAAVLADEPVASLDPRSAEDVMQALHNIHTTKGLPVVVNLHQVDVARRFASRIVGMRSGRVVFDGPPSELDDRTARGLYGELDASETTVIQARGTGVAVGTPSSASDVAAGTMP